MKTRSSFLAAALLLLLSLPVMRQSASAQVVTTFAGSSAGFTNATGTAAQFNTPAGIGVGTGSVFFVADKVNNRIRRISSAGAVTTFAGSGVAGFADAMGTSAQFSGPTGVVFSSPDLYVADAGNHLIRRINAGGSVTTFAGSGTGGFADGTGAAAQFQFPVAIAVDGSGNFYVADFLNHSIRKITSAGVVTTLAGNGTSGYVDATGAAARFNFPSGVAVDGAGNVYVADQLNHRIRRITPAGVVTTFAGNGTAGWLDGTGTAARFSSPAGLAIDGAGNIIVADQGNHRIRQITPAGVVTTLAGSGSAGSTDATGLAAQFNQPNAVAVDGTTIYVADQGNNRIRAIAPPPVPTITSFTPTSAGAGMTVTITGTNFLGAGAVSFGGVAATSFTVVSATQITAVVAAGSASGSVAVTAPGGTATLAGFNFIPPPTITGFTPTSAGGGTTVQITGTDLATTTAVSFGGVPAASFTIISANQVNAVVAAGGASGSISITTLGGTGSLAGFTFIPVPVISSFAPTSAAVGATVVLTGTGFTGATAVTFGGVPAASFNVDSPTQISAVVAAGGATGSIAVTTPGGTGTRTGFTFIAPPTITSFTPTSSGLGLTVTINGTNLSGATAVTFGGVPATSFMVVSSMQITAVVAAGASGSVQVTNPGGTATLAGFTWVAAPTITSIMPMSGAVGAVITIDGTNFTGATTVRFGGIPAASFMIVSSTQITAVVAAGGATGAVQVVTPGGTGSLAGFTFLPSPPTITSFTPANRCPGGTVTITGTNFVAPATVTFGGVAAASVVIGSPTSITATVAAGGASGVIGVTTPGGTVNSAGMFTFSPTPTITGIAPTMQSGGGTVTITGTNLTGATAVSFGGVPAASFAVMSATQIDAVVAAGGASGNVVVTSPGGCTATFGGFTFNAPVPTVTSFTPMSAAAGTTVTINGTGFTGATQVRFGGVNAASFIVVNSMQITAVVAAGGASGSITVTTPGGPGSMAGFTFIPPPVITTFTPTTQGSGGIVTINGSGFTGATAVRFGTAAFGTATPAAGFVVVNDNQITATVGAGATGRVWVMAPGSGTAASATGFTFAPVPTITSFTPTSAGTGMTITITGTGFTAPATVTFGGVPATGVTVVSLTQITANVAAGATGLVSVTTPGGTVNSVGPFTFVAAPTIATFSPTSAAVGATVTITGTNLSGATAVTFGGVPAMILTNSMTTITAQVGAGGASGSVQVTTVGGTATATGFLLLPNITSFTPTSAGAAMTVTINGTGFTGATAVSFGGVAAASYTVVSSTQITAVVPVGGASGSIQVTTPGGSSSFAGFNFIPPPTVTGFLPTSAPGGTMVVITGTDFLTATGVSFGGTAAASFVVNSATQITAVVSAGGSTGAVQVTTLGGTNNLAGFTFIPSPPTMTSFTPTTAGAGATVTIIGTNFAGVSVVSFGGTAAASYTVVSPTQINAVVGAGASGSVRVTALGGTIMNPGFTFILPPTISSFTPTSAAVGATVTINGANFTGATAVSFGGVPAASFTVVSAMQITAVVAAGGASGNVSVTTPGGTGTSAGFNFLAPPTIGGFAPTSAAAGATVTITGTNFTGATAVSFGGVPAASFMVNSPTQITAVVASGGATGNVSVTAPGGTITSGGFAFVAPPNITSFSPTSAAQGATVLINGSNFTGATGVTFGGVAATGFTVITDNLMTAVVGTGSTGNLQVTGPGGTGTRTGFSFATGPMITSVSPSSAGPGMTVIINGAGFLSASVVSFGGVPAASYTVLSPSQISAVIAAGGASGNVLVTTPGGTGTLGGFAFFPTPTVTSFTPTMGNPGAGITINGTNFTGTTSVTIGGVPVTSFMVTSPTQIGAVVSTGATGSVTVSTPGGTASLAGFTVTIPPPTITSFTPTASASNASITITGTNFFGVSAVSFGGTPAGSFTVNSATQITAVVALGATGNVSVTTLGGTATRSGFTFYPPPTISSFTPTSAPTGTFVTINGNNFLSVTDVRFGSQTAANYTVLSPTQISAQIGIGGSGNVTVSASGGTVSAPGFTYLPAPVISGFFPASAGPGMTITINGANFTGATQVRFGGVAASSFMVMSSSQITAVIAGGSTGSISVTSGAGTGISSGFTFVLPPTITSFTPTVRGPNMTVTITGTNFTGATLVQFGGVSANSFTVNSPTQITAVVGLGGASGSVTVQNLGGSASLAGFTFIPAPIITNFTPTSGEPGETIIISGSNFTGVTNVSFGGITAASFTVVSPNQIRAVVPGNAGNSLVVISSGGTATLAGFTFVPAPTITSFTPNSAGPNQTVNIIGTNFSSATKITFGGVSAKSFEVLSPSLISAVVSEDAFSGHVAVFTADGSDSASGFIFIPPVPTITSFSPTTAGPGMTVTISGTGFRGTSTASFGGVAAESFRVTGQTQITAIISTGASGSVAISTPGGRASLSGFTFAPAPAISSISPSTAVPGDTITITGVNLAEVLSVRIGNVAAAFILVSPTQIRAVVPRSGGSVVITTPGGSAVSSAFTTIPPPIIASFTPTVSPAGGTVDIRGVNFIGVRTVRFGTSSVASFRVVADTLITAVIGNGASGSVSVTTTAGTATLAGFRFIGAPTIMSFSPIGAGTGIAVTIIGTNFTDITSVNFGSVSAASFTVVSPTQIIAIVPNDAVVANISGDITISGTGGTFRLAGFTFLPPPVLTAFSPTSAGPGTTITLTGRNLTGVSVVRFGGVTAASFSVVSDTLLTAVLASGSSGTVSVVSSGGTASLEGFAYVPPPPVVSSFTPTSAGADVTVTINGANFVDVTAVRFGNIDATRFTVVSPTQITAVVGAGASGSVSVTSQTGTGSRMGFSFIPAPTVTNLTPRTAGAGATVLITGTNFANTRSVSFGGVPAADFTVVSPTEIRAVLGTGASGSVVVTTPGGIGTLAGFTLIPAPRVSSFSPTSAPAGAVVTIGGANFTGVSSVSFGGVATTGFTVFSSTQITAIVPVGAIGGAISVTTPGGTGSLGGFTPIAPPTISNFSPASAGVGTVVVITGSNFTTGATVRFGNTLASNVMVVSPTQIRATVPLGTTGGSISVTTVGGTVTQNGFSLLNAPRITAFSPTIGSSGTIVIITGANLTGALSVNFGTTSAASFTLLSDTQIRAVVGTGASGSVSVTTPGGTGALAGFSYLGAPSVAGFTPTSAGAGRIVTIIGTSFTGARSVSFGGVEARRFTVVSPTQISAEVGSGASGDVAVTTSGGSGKLAGFTFLPAPIVTSFSPASGATGTRVVITGSNLNGATSVVMGGTSIPFRVDNAGQITVIVPIGGVGDGAITVNTAGGVGISNEAFRFIPPPMISSAGVVQSRQGTILRIVGQNFVGTTTVNIGRISVPFTIINQSQVTAAIPVGTSQNEAVSLFTPGGVAVSSGAPPQPTITSVTPSRGMAGTRVLISGQALRGTTQASIGGIDVPFTILSSAQVELTIPSAGASGVIGLVTPQGVVTTTTTFTLITSEPSIASFSPTQGDVGTIVRVRGENFGQVNGVFIGGVSIPFRIASASELVLTIPVGATSGNIVLVSPIGVTISSGRFIFAPGGVLPPTPDPIAVGTVKCYPNPATDNITVAYALDKPYSVKIHLLDMRGNTLQTLDQGKQDKGEYTTTLTMSSYAIGTYIVVVQTPVRKMQALVTVVR